MTIEQIKAEAQKASGAFQQAETKVSGFVTKQESWISRNAAKIFWGGLLLVLIALVSYCAHKL